MYGSSQSWKQTFLSYDLRNRSDRAVRYYSIANRVVTNVESWYKYGDGGRSDAGRPNGTGPILLNPGEVLHEWPFRQFEIIPMNHDTEALLAPDLAESRLRVVWIVAVHEAKLEDGSVFHGSSHVDGISDMEIRLPK